MLLIFTAVVLAYVLSWQLQPWTGGNYVYTITSDSALGGGEVICVQYKSNMDGWVYHQAECAGSGTTWICTIPGPVTGGTPPSNGYNYEFYAQSTGSCGDMGGGNSWTGEQWQETNPITAVTLSSLTAASALPAAIPWLTGAALALGGMLAWRRKRG